MSTSKIWVALDVGVDKALYLTEMLKRHVCGLKVGPKLYNSILRELITAESQTSAEFRLAKVRSLFALIGEDLFWDCKLHDTPNTVAGAVAELMGIHSKMSTVHASAGMKTMRAAVANRGSSLMLAVTLLSSQTEEDIHEIYGASIRAKFLQFARFAVSTGFDGIVCSPKELIYLHEYEDEFENLFKITPNIRPKDSPSDDQDPKRTMTAYDAIMAGADYLVIGRPIVEASDPTAVAKKINAEIALALKHREEKSA